MPALSPNSNHPERVKVRKVKASSSRPETAGNPNVAKPRVRRVRPAPAPKPTATQIRSSRAQERGYRSQGHAIKKVAKRQETTARAKAQERGYRSQGRQVEKSANRGNLEQAVHRRYPKISHERISGMSDKLLHYAVHQPDLRSTKLEATGVRAPVLKALAFTTRPLHAVAAATRRDIAEIKRGHIHLTYDKGAIKAAGRGITNKDKSTFSDVAKDLGVHNKVARSVLGFAGDVVLDPTTYITGGTGTVAEKAAVDAAEKATRKALAKGLTKEQARAFGERAAKHVADTHPQGKGLKIKFAGREAPGVRRATEKAARPVKKVARKVVPEKARQGARSIAADVNPNVAPAGVSRAEHEAATRAIRTARAKATQGRHAAITEGEAIRRKISKEDYSKVIDALEAEAKGGKAGRRAIAKLPPELRDVAVRLRAGFRHDLRLRKQAGIKGGERKGYVPHHLTEEAQKAEGKKAGGVGAKVIRPSSSRARKEQRSLAELRTQEPGRYSEDLPQLRATRKMEAHDSKARADLNRQLADMGHTIKRGEDVHLRGGEKVYKITGSDIREADPKELDRFLNGWDAQRKALAAKLKDEGKSQDEIAKALQKLKTTTPASGRFVVLNEDLVKRALEGVGPRLKGTGVIHAVDKATSGFKRVAIATPGFHIRNLIGDTQNAYLGQAGHRLPGNMVRAGRVLKARARQDEGLRNLTAAKVGKGTINTPRYGKVTYDEAAKQLAEHGAFRSGYVARELPELSKSGAEKSLKVRRVHLPHAAKNALLNREDLPRLTTAVEALRRGATWQQAADKVAELHFDYAHLTDFERQVARRVVPFYTFSARNIPLQARKFVTNPGKYANYEKIREEAAKATGADQQNADTNYLYGQLNRAGVKLPKGWERQLSEWEQRNAGVPVSWRGGKFTVSFGLPLQDLSEFPGLAGSNQGGEYLDKFMSLVTPILKDPLEFGFNFSFFFRDQIESDRSPLVTAPGWVSVLPPAAKRDLGIVKIVDRKTGRKVWGWRGKADYLAKALPGSPSYIQQLSSGGSDRRGKGTGGKLLSFFGVKSVPVDPIKNAIALSYQREAEILKRKAALKQQGIDAKHPNAEFRRLTQQEATINAIQEGTRNGLNRRLIEIDNRIADVKAKLAKTKRSDDGFYYTSQYQNLLDQRKALADRRDKLLKKKPTKVRPISRRPLTLRQKLEQQRNDLRSGDLRQKLERDVQRERARSRIISGG